MQIPIPPLKLRQLVGTDDPVHYGNESGTPIYADFDVPLECYESVFDFGCGCGRVARQLLLQRPKPRRYIGIDTSLEMIVWCQQNLTRIDPAFQFHFHDVYSPCYGAQNTLQLSAPLPAPDRGTSLFIAHSVFTHLTTAQAAFYLGELARVLAPGGVAFTSWFFFDRAGFPLLLDGPVALYTSDADFAQAVVVDRIWFLETVRRLNLRVRSTTLPGIPGHQWVAILEHRTGNAPDRFPMGDDGARSLCGAAVTSAAVLEEVGRSNDTRPDLPCPAPPELQGALAELRGAVAELDALKRSRSWRFGRIATAPWRLVKRSLGLPYDDVETRAGRRAAPPRNPLNR